MNSKMSILAGVLLLSTAAFAQDAKKEKAIKNERSKYTSIGPVLGFGHSEVSNMVNDYKPSAQLGIGMIYSRYEHWGWGSVLTASHEGYTREVYANGQAYDNTINPVYVRLTPRAYYFFGDYKDNVRPKIYLGPSVAYKVAEDQWINEPFTPTEAQLMRSSGEVFRNWDFGANVGAGVNIKMAKATWLNLDADYYHGLINVTSMQNKNRALRANVGIMFGI